VNGRGIVDGNYTIIVVIDVVMIDAGATKDKVNNSTEGDDADGERTGEAKQ